MIIEPARPFLACEFQVKFATARWERDRAAALRREVFCREQKIFDDDDRDAIDDIAIPLVALSSLAIAHEDVCRNRPYPRSGTRAVVGVAPRRCAAGTEKSGQSAHR